MSVSESESAKAWRIPRVTRQFWVLMHRWVGLSILIFVFQVGLSGAFLAFNDELDNLFLGSWASVEPSGPLLAPEALEAAFVAAYPDATPDLPVDYADHPRESVVFWIDPPEGELLGRDVFMNPYSGEILGERVWGAISLRGENIMPMIYRLHYSLLIQEWDGWGFWIMGIVVLLWALDHAASLIVSIPRSGPFWKAMTIKWRGSAYRINFDFHRAGGLTVWVITLMLCLTGAAWNSTFFGTNIVHAALDAMGGSTPYPTDTIEVLEVPLDAPPVTRLQAREIAATRLTAEGEEVHAWWVGYYAEQGVYDVWATLNTTETRFWVAAIDGATGEIVGVRAPSDRTVVDVIKDWIYPLHSGHAFGLIGQIIICLTGLATAAFCVTGFVIWRKKWLARRQQHRQQRLRASA